MERSFDYRNLFVLDMANNHQGSVEHGLKIVREMSDVANKNGVRAAIKFQFRQLDSFIHPEHQEGSELSYIQRFQGTRLERAQYQVLVDEVRSRGLLAACTPFDEESVGVIVDMDFDIIKIASCSAKDWPLLEEVADAGKPVIFSTGGITLHDIDNLVSFFDHWGVEYAIMHCVSIYPTPPEQLHLLQISALQERYPGVAIGWSTHEDPADTEPVQMATALGAQMFERHVGVETDDIQLNAYSSTPDQVNAWFEAQQRARVMCGSFERPPVAAKEQEALDGLRRGAYARRPIRRGVELTRDMVYFAMPYNEGQLDSGSWRSGIVASEDVPADAPVQADRVRIPRDHDVKILKTAVHEVKALLHRAKIALGTDFKVEYSHHYGVSNFRRVGAVLIECINREYCKKLVVQLPGQKHPSHFHKRKEETFQVLYGCMHSVIDGVHRELRAGETVLVQPGCWHSFWTDTGVIFEEVSTTHYTNDSFYEDKRINKMQSHERKTVVDHWGRFQLRSREHEHVIPLPPEYR